MFNDVNTYFFIPLMYLNNSKTGLYYEYYQLKKTLNSWGFFYNSIMFVNFAYIFSFFYF